MLFKRKKEPEQKIDYSSLIAMQVGKLSNLCSAKKINPETLLEILTIINEINSYNAEEKEYFFSKDYVIIVVQTKIILKKRNQE